MESMTNFSAIADGEGAIVAYPEGTKVSEDGTRSWNARFCCRDAMGVNADDIGFLSTLIDDLKERYDVRGVLVTGFSNGGMLAHLAGIELSNKITAIAPIAASIGQVVIGMRPQRALPVLIVHGTDDRILPIGGTDDGRLLPVSTAVGYWVGANKCQDKPVTEFRNGFEVTKYAQCSDAAEVLFYRIWDAGHVWPGSRVRMRSEHDPGTMDASAVIWDFFRAHLF
jgi:polyhydroxybutyrate depolymerase